MTELSPRDAEAAAWRARFAPGDPGVLYFDASSIGPMPASAPERMRRALDGGWRAARRRAWSEFDWMDQPSTLGAAIAGVIGAGTDDVRVCDTTTVNQYKLLRYALSVKAPRRTMVVEADVFPSNLHAAEGIARAGIGRLRTIAGMHELPAALAEGDVAVVALSHVDYRSSARLPMAEITAQVHAAGASVLWDLSHSAGALAIGLGTADVDFAVGSGYKYLCGGPGAPAFMFVHPRWQEAAWPAICGWMGHANTNAFEPVFRPAQGMDRHLVATPSVLANEAFAAAADIWREVDPVWLDTRHRDLSEALIAQLERECGAFGLELASPREHALRGGHVAFRFPDAESLANALVANGVVVSARKPDALRLAPHPLVTDVTEITEAVARLREILESGRWRNQANA